MDRILYRYIIFIAGLYFLSMGIVLIVSSTLGTTPISSVNYVLSLHTPLTLGIATFLINVILIAGQFWLIRGRGTRKIGWRYCCKSRFRLFSLSSSTSIWR